MIVFLFLFFFIFFFLPTLPSKSIPDCSWRELSQKRARRNDCLATALPPQSSIPGLPRSGLGRVSGDPVVSCVRDVLVYSLERAACPMRASEDPYFVAHHYSYTPHEPNRCQLTQFAERQSPPPPSPPLPPSSHTHTPTHTRTPTVAMSAETRCRQWVGEGPAGNAGQIKYKYLPTRHYSYVS